MKPTEASGVWEVAVTGLPPWTNLDRNLVPKASGRGPVDSVVWCPQQTLNLRESRVAEKGGGGTCSPQRKLELASFSLLSWSR